MNKFWLVMRQPKNEPRDVPCGNVSLKKHETRMEAEKEAERLAIKQPSDVFVVLEARTCCQSSQVKWELCEPELG